MDNNLEPALYVVATPVGNLEDITLRALRILKSADIIAAEDTRTTSVLLDKYAISTRLMSYHKFSESKKTGVILEYLSEGKSVALVSDAGTPLISDPGEVLVKNVLKAGFKVIPIPGACAVTTLLSAIPREKEEFKFTGFLPRSESQIADLISKNRAENLVFYESPNRIVSSLETIEKKFPDAKIALGRELTKKFEEIKTDNVKDLIDFYKKNPPKGEIAAMIYAIYDENKDKDFTEEIRKLKGLKFKDKEIAQILAALFDGNKNAIYKKCLEID